MMSKIKRAVFVVLIFTFVLFQTAYASDINFGDALTDMILKNTNADIAIVTVADVSDAQANSSQKINVYELSGDILFDGLSSLISGSKTYPHISGASLEIKTQLGTGLGESSVLGEVYISNDKIKKDAIYTVAVSDGASEMFKSANLIHQYSSNSKALFEYINSFNVYDNSVQESENERPQVLDSADFLERQKPILILSLSLLAAVTLLYLILKKKKSNS